MEKALNPENFLSLYEQTMLQDLDGRYLSFLELQKVLENLEKDFELQEIGRSFLGIPIQSLRVGEGSIRILAWSQMHGNETTTTRGILDLVHMFQQKKRDPLVAEILQNCTLLLIPMLNPDGAARYIRENANKVDLNRDAQELREPESRVLRECFERFEPDYCLNLHDQRSIFSAGNKPAPASMSFLAPSMDRERSINLVRKKAMQVIAGINRRLQTVIPGQVGRFDDAFNLNCTGDTFQRLGVPTILFEAGHFQDDYNRQESRRIFSFSAFVALHEIATGKTEQNSLSQYQEIPENKKCFFDIILRRADTGSGLHDVGIQFKEILRGTKVEFEPEVRAIEEHLEHFGHQEIDCSGKQVRLISEQVLNENDIVPMILLNNKKLSIKTH